MSDDTELMSEGRSVRFMPDVSKLIEIKDHSPRWVRDAAIQVSRGFGRMTAWSRVAPDFLVIGTKRGGTTSLFNYLLMHPGVLGLYPRPRLQKSTDYFFKEYQRGDNWYRSNFHSREFRERFASRLGFSPLSGEASPMYIWDPRIARRARLVNPQLKSIVLLRDPVKRAYSHWQERRQNGVEPLSFQDALAAEDARTSTELGQMLQDPSYQSDAYDWYTYRARGIYQPQIQNWLEAFPADQLLILRSEDLYSNVQATFDHVCTFLGIPTVVLPTTEAYNASGRTLIPHDSAAELKAFYGPHNRALEEYLGRSLWS